MTSFTLDLSFLKSVTPSPSSPAEKSSMKMLYFCIFPSAGFSAVARSLAKICPRSGFWTDLVSTIKFPNVASRRAFLEPFCPSTAQSKNTYAIYCQRMELDETVIFLVVECLVLRTKSSNFGSRRAFQVRRRYIEFS